MKDWLESEAEWDFELNPNYKLTKRDRKVRAKLWLENLFNIEISKKHYKDLGL
jgi:hypothetical protein